MNRKIILTVLFCLCMTACTKPSASSTVKQESSQEQVTVTKKGENSLHPNVVTDYDRAAITSLINMDLKDRFGKNGYEDVYADNIDFYKKDGILTAEGNYVCYEDGYEVLGFTYRYIDEATYYTLDFADVGREPGSGDTANTNPFGREPDLSYDLTIVRYITITFTHNGDGMCRIVILDEHDQLIEEVLNQSGDIDIEKKVSVPEWGKYKLQFFCTGGGYSLAYNCTEE